MKELPDAKFRYIEHELYNYKHTLKELDEIDVDDIETESMGNLAPYDKFSTTEKYEEGSSTEVAAFNRLENKVAVSMLRTVKAVNRMFKQIKKEDKNKAKLFYFKYIEKENRKQIMQELNISKSTFYRWRDEIVLITAEEMGLIAKITK